MTGILEYYEGSTVVHQLNPVTKLMLSVSICIACFLTNSIPVMGFLICAGVAIGAAGGIIGRALSLLKSLCKVCIFLFVLQLLFVRDGKALFLFVTDEGLILAAKISLRLIGATIPLALVLALTQMSDLSNALVSVLHVPYKYAFTLTTAIRFIPVFFEEMNGIIEAQTSRGVEFDTGNPVKKMKLILPLCAPLLITSVKKADSSAMAVELRGFNLRDRKSGYKTYSFQLCDIITLLISIMLITMAAVTH